MWIRDGVEGPLQGCNIDDIRRPFEAEQLAPPEEGPDGEPVKGIKCIDGVSASVLCDEEPEDIFPVDPRAVMPREISIFTSVPLVVTKTFFAFLGMSRSSLRIMEATSAVALSISVMSPLVMPREFMFSAAIIEALPSVFTSAARPAILLDPKSSTVINLLIWDR